MPDIVTIKELRMRGGEVVDRVAAGVPAVITRDGRPVARLEPLPAEALDVRAIVERFRRLPPMNAEALRRDVDSVVDQSL